ncbi:MAG: class I SAM-dependent methyltransferase [Candidatus Krumholzibacteriia bacterium]
MSDAALERLEGPPLPAPAALGLAAALAVDGDHVRACRVLRRVARVSRQTEPAEALSTYTCRVFEDILAVANDRRDLDSLKLRHRDRLLKALSRVLGPLQGALGVVGRVARRAGFPNGVVIEDLADRFAQQCWVSGLPANPGFVGDARRLGGMTGYESSRVVYRDVFRTYLEHWVDACLSVEDLLLATVKPADAHALYCIVREKRPSVVLEIGSFVGFSTCLMAWAVKDNGTGEIHCVDPNLKHLSVDRPLAQAESALGNLGLERYVQIHEGFFSPPSGDMEGEVLGPGASRLLPPVELAFIDGDHSTWSVIQDFVLLLPCLAPEATVVFHDTKAWRSVRQGIQIVLGSGMWEQYNMRYSEIIPSGFDGLGIVEISKVS